MSESYATKKELSDVRKEMYEGFESVNKSIGILAENTNKSIENLSHEITTTIQKSMTSDFSLRSDFTKEFEAKDKDRRNTTFKIAGLALGLIMTVWSAVWWSINEHGEKTRVEDKLEMCREVHKIDKRILILELGK